MDGEGTDTQAQGQLGDLSIRLPLRGAVMIVDGNGLFCGELKGIVLCLCEKDDLIVTTLRAVRRVRQWKIADSCQEENEDAT